jgi:hypothetical protein
VDAGGGGGGGGGSSFITPTALSSDPVEEGVSSGHGQMVIEFQPPPPAPPTSPRPNTRITKKPGDGRCKKRSGRRCKKGERGQHRWVFRFEDDIPGVAFLCQLDNGPVEPCGSPKAYKGLKPGKHTFKVRSVDQNGVESSPQTAKFRVGGKRR